MNEVLRPTDASLKALDGAVSELARRGHPALQAAAYGALVEAGVDIPRLQNALRAGAGARDETA